METESTNIPTSQVVMAYPDSVYTVRTYESRDGRWVQVREVPASLRDIVQATMAGRVAVVEQDIH